MKKSYKIFYKEELDLIRLIATILNKTMELLLI